MIRINLLGAPKPKKGKRAAISISLGGEGNILVAALVIVALTVVANGGWWWKLGREREQIDRELVAAQNENLRLQQVKAKYLEREKQKDDYKRRVDVIDQLRANQAGPVTLLSNIGETVNATDAVWLNVMRDDGAAINIEGMALSVHAVANLMQNLKKTGYFKSVEIKESYQDEQVQEMQAFVFTLVCEKQPVKPGSEKKS